MAKAVVALIRHGDYHQLAHTPSAHQPFALNEAGIEQAKACVEKITTMLQANQWQLHPVIHSSNLLRGWQTARILMDAMPSLQQLKGFDELAERGMGSAANLNVQQIETILQQDPRFDAPPPDWKSNSHYQLPLQGAESLMQAGQRVAKHLISSLQQLSANIETDTLQLVVGHGAAFRHAAYHMKVLAFEDIARLSMFHATPVAIAMNEEGSFLHVAGDWKQRNEQENLD